MNMQFSALMSPNKFDDYSYLRSYLSDDGTVAHLLKLVSALEIELKEEMTSGADVSAELIDGVAMLRYGLCAIDYVALDRTLEKLRLDYDQKLSTGEESSEKVLKAAVEALAIFERLEECCTYQPTGPLSHLETMPRHLYSHAFLWLPQLRDLVTKRQAAGSAQEGAKLSAQIGQMLMEYLPDAIIRVRCMVDRRFNNDVQVPQALNNYHVEAGRIGDYIDQMAELVALSRLDWQEEVKHLSMWAEYLGTWWSRFNNALDVAYADYRPCLVGNADLWQNHVRPRVEREQAAANNV